MEDRRQRERRFWDSYAGSYDPLIERLKRAYGRIIETARDHIDPSKNVLEVATGTGTITLGIADRAGAVKACDISPKMIDIAQRKLAERKFTNVSFSVQDAYDLNYPDGSFDVVIVSNALHVMISPERALASMARVMRQEGVLFAPTYCHGHSFLSRMVSRVMSLRGFEAHHRWSVSALQAFFEGNGFRVVNLQVVGGAIPLALPVLCKSQGEIQ